jgi:hypothetical protein
MVSQNYTRSEYDHCVYFKKLNNGIFIILVLYANDMLLARKSITEINRLKAQMARMFDMKDLRAARQILGWRYPKIGGMVSFGCHNKSMLRRYF